MESIRIDPSNEESIGSMNDTHGACGEKNSSFNQFSTRRNFFCLSIGDRIP